MEEELIDKKNSEYLLENEEDALKHLIENLRDLTTTRRPFENDSNIVQKLNDFPNLYLLSEPQQRRIVKICIELNVFGVLNVVLNQFDDVLNSPDFHDKKHLELQTAIMSFTAKLAQSKTLCKIVADLGLLSDFVEELSQQVHLAFSTDPHTVPDPNTVRQVQNLFSIYVKCLFTFFFRTPKISKISNKLGIISDVENILFIINIDKYAHDELSLSIFSHKN